MTPLSRLVLLCAVLVVTATGCSKQESPEPTRIAAATEDVSQYRDRLGPELWAGVQEAPWLDGNLATPDGARLLEAVASTGPLVTLERKLALLKAYPDGLTEERLATARQYAAWTITAVPDILDAAWLLDGVDDYERAVFDAAAERTI
jgi:hypothetical protein